MGKKVALQGISIREFARREPCSEGLVRRARDAGHLVTFEDGSLDPELVHSPWRFGNRQKLGAHGDAHSVRAAETPEQIANRIVNEEGRAPYSLAEAERIKENFLALLRELEYDQKSGAVVMIEAVATSVASIFAMVRGRILSIPAETAPRLAILRSAEEVEAFLALEISRVLEDLTFDARKQAEATARE